MERSPGAAGTSKGTDISTGLRPAWWMVSNSPLGLLYLTGFHAFPARGTDRQERMGVEFFTCSAAELRGSRSLGILLPRWRHLILIVKDFQVWSKPLIELSTGEQRVPRCKKKMTLASVRKGNQKNPGPQRGGFCWIIWRRLSEAKQIAWLQLP